MALYKPAKGAAFNARQAKALGAVLEQIGFTATPQQIVEAARPKKSPIHDMFDWDNSSAAEKYRLWQARQHASHLEIVIVTETGNKATRAFHSVIVKQGNEAQRGYCSMENIAENPDLSEQVIAKALAELNGWKARYAEYREVLSGIFAAIDEANGMKRKRRAKAVA